MTPPHRRIGRETAGLVVIDIQERLLPAIHQKERVVQNALVLIRGFQALGRPILLTEQYRRGLGSTVPEVAATLNGIRPAEKLTFSAAGVPDFEAALSASGATDLVLCGIEAHVCVCQTGLGLLDRGFRVFVVADAVSSRTPENWQAGVDRIRDAGGTVVSTEMVLFELLERAGTPEFKTILNLVK